MSCATCSNGTACDSCNLTQFRQSTPTVGSFCACLNGYYDSGAPVCQACLYSCLHCTSATSCSACDSASHRITDGTQCSCETGYFDTQTNTAMCAACSTKCFTCSQSASNCTSCKSTDFRTMSLLTSNVCDCMTRYYDDGINAMCAACLYKCATCSNATACQTCSSSAYRYMSTGGQC